MRVNREPRSPVPGLSAILRANVEGEAMRYEVRTTEGELIRTTPDKGEATEWADKRPAQRVALDRELGRVYRNGEWSAEPVAG